MENMVADKGKKPKLAEKADKEEPEINHQTYEALVVSFEKLQDIQDNLEKINEEASDEILKVNQKYKEKRRPVYKERDVIMKNIPDFWFTAFLTRVELSVFLEDEEGEKIFEHLTSLEVDEEEGWGYSITFNFESNNPYFENTKLTKTFTFLYEQGITEITATPIQWKQHMMDDGSGGADFDGNKRPVMSSNKESFFARWFSSVEHDDDEEIAEIIKELWANPLSYFNSESDDGEDFDSGKAADDGDKDGGSFDQVRHTFGLLGL